MGACAGGAVFGVIALLDVALGESQGWWRIPKTNASYFQFLFWLGFSVSVAPVYLITWRVAHRFGNRGLAVCTVASAIIGPPCDYTFAAVFPEWIVFSPGIAPILAVATVYALLIVVGHAVMCMVAGPVNRETLR